MPLEPPPIPLKAEAIFGPGPVAITWDRALQANPALDTANWFIRLQNIQRFPAVATAVGDVVLITHTLGPADVGDNVVSYRPPPFDVISDFGRDAEAFEDFPVTILGP